MLVESSGRVEAVKVSRSAGWFRMRAPGAPIQEWFFVWVAVPDEMCAEPSRRQTAQIDLIREALVHGLEVAVVHEETSSSVVQLELLTV